MRWSELFADLEAHADALSAAARAAEAGERTRIEVGSIGMLDRLSPSAGASVRLRMSGDLVVSGVLRRCGPGWALIEGEHGRESVLCLAAVLSIGGLARLSAAPDASARRPSQPGIGHLLRAIATDRSTVQVHLVDGSSISGTLERVGKDFVELTTHQHAELPRHRDVRELVLLPLHAVAVVQREL